YESGGILVVGPTGAYTAYIERVLPSLGEESVTLRAVGEIVDAVDTERLDPPPVARIKGSTRIRTVLGKAARGRVPGAPTEFRAFVAGRAVRLEAPTLDRVRSQVLRQHQRNLATAAARAALGEAAWSSLGITGDRDAKAEFLDRWEDHLDVEAFMAVWWPQVDPREVLTWLADPDLLRRHGRGVLDDHAVDLLATSFATALAVGTWSVADVALIDDLSAKVGPVQEAPREERGFYEIEELDDLSQYGVTEVQPVSATRETRAEVIAEDPRGRLIAGRIGKPDEYAHILVDEAQDLSPMQWRMIGRRGRHASWTIVGDAAQASWTDAEEARAARDEAFGKQQRRGFHMATNYRNAREIFDYAAAIIRREVPDADIPEAVRETGHDVVEGSLGRDARGSVQGALDALVEQVAGAIAVVTPQRYAAELAPLDGSPDGRVQVVDPMSTKGLEYDAVVVVDPREIARESPGGIRVLYVALTRAAHRMTVLS
ncbi:MAG TPA: ATP-binding domain-containing protein, partial [Intrasporangium sp.]|nr:ATP-binding domain-containing protein [Intrasporangium sp.]